MSTDKKKNAGKTETHVRKEFLRGNVTDENTLKSSLVFFGSLLIVYLMAFIVCMTTAGSDIIRLISSAAVIIMMLSVFFNKGSSHGAEAVSRGEILWQKEKKGQPVAESEKRASFHPMKAFVIGLIGSAPLVLIAVIFAINTRIQTTTAGTLPSWIQGYLRRDDIAGPLVSYTQASGMGVTDILRIIVRIAIMPFINFAGSENYKGILVMERLSPLIMLLPACAYGTGYLRGPEMRARVHTAISENDRIRKRKEKKERRIRAGIAARPKEPEKLN